MAFEWSIFHPSKNVPLLYDFVVLGENLSGAAFRMTFAATQGAAAVITLNAAAAGLQGVSAAYNSAYLHPVTGAAVGATTLKVQIDEATLKALTFPAAPTALKLAYDLLITPSGLPQRVHAYGTLTIAQGVGD